MNGMTPDSPPLDGWRVLVTRARAQANQLSDALRERGAEVIELPAIEIVPAATEPLDAAVAQLGTYDWIVFTSVNGVDAFVGRMAACGVPADALNQIQVGVIGRGTERRLCEQGVEVDFVPEQFVAESVVEGLVARGVAAQRVLLPRAEIARDVLPDGLRAAGATVDVVTAYRTVLPNIVDDTVIDLLRAGVIDAATFASPSTVRNVVELLGGPLPASVVIASIGPITAAALQECGLRVDVQAGEYSIPGLVEGLCDFALSNPRRVRVS